MSAPSTRDTILDAAQRIAAERGAAGFSMPRLSKALSFAASIAGIMFNIQGCRLLPLIS